jgi:hypothetical protein
MGPGVLCGIPLATKAYQRPPCGSDGHPGRDRDGGRRLSAPENQAVSSHGFGLALRVTHERLRTDMALPSFVVASSVS